MTPLCHFSDFKKSNHVTGKFLKNFFPKDGPPSSMVLLVFLESENLLKIRQFPNWETCLTGHDIIWAGRASPGEHGGVGFILGGWV